MKSLTLLTIVTTLCLALATGAQAEKVSFNTPRELKGKCDSAGGLYFPPTGPNSAYACLGKNGSLVACGGEGEYATTCDATPGRKQLDMSRILKLRTAPVATAG